jgi:hypothetical protein
VVAGMIRRPFVDIVLSEHLEIVLQFWVYNGLQISIRVLLLYKGSVDLIQ